MLFHFEWLIVVLTFICLLSMNYLHSTMLIWLSLLTISYLLVQAFMLVRKQSTRRRGVELLAINVILAVLFAFTAPNAHNAGKKSPTGSAAGTIGALNCALALYQVDCDSQSFPATTLMQLYSDNAAGWAGPYMATITNDPWGNCYTYTSNGRDYTIQTVHVGTNHKSETIRYVFSSGMIESHP